MDALVNNATVAVLRATVAQQTSMCLQKNATGDLSMVEAFAPVLKAEILGIINMCSDAGLVPRCLDPTALTYKHSAVQYRASKPASNKVTACQVAD